jgi:hypothetical protein
VIARDLSLLSFLGRGSRCQRERVNCAAMTWRIKLASFAPQLHRTSTISLPINAAQEKSPTLRCDETYQAEIPTRQNSLGPTGAMSEPYPARLGVRARSERCMPFADSQRHMTNKGLFCSWAHSSALGTRNTNVHRRTTFQIL